MRRAWVPLALALVPVFVQAGLGPRYGGELHVGALGSPPSVDPHAPAGATDRLVLGMVHETLVRPGPDGPRPGIAESWAPGADPREWTLTLSPRLQFHDGASVGAEDARRSIRRFLRSGTPAAAVLAEALEGGTAFRAGAAADVFGLEAPEPLALRLRFRVPASEWSLLPLASPAAALVSEGGAPCGPFVPTTSHADELMFVPFGAHLEGRPYVDRVRIRLVPDGRRLMADRRLGRVDVALGAPAGLALAPGVVVLALDPGRPPFDARPVRQAIAAAIDRASLAGRMLDGAEPWSRLLPRAAAEDIAPPAPPAPPPYAPGASIVLAVDRTLPPLASQRIVAHLAVFGFTTTVRAVEPGALRQTPAEARLFLFEPEIDEPVLTVHELASLFEPADVPLAALESSRAAREAMALDLEQRLRAAATLIPLARLARSTEIAGRVRGVRADAYTLRLDGAWTSP